MNYQIGDYIAHPGHGVCTVEGMRERSVGGRAVRYYALVPQSDPQTTILIPVDNLEKAGMRSVISEVSADAILEFFADCPVRWEKNPQKRRVLFDTALKSGDMMELAGMVKNLLVHETLEPLGRLEKELLPRAQERLFSEIALAKGME